MHASIVLGQDILEYAALFAEIADAYFARGMYAEAGNIYEMLGADAGVSALILLFRLLLTYRARRPVACIYFSKPRHVVKCWVTSKRPQISTHMVSYIHQFTIYVTENFVVIRADPTHNDARMKLAGIYEIMDEPRKALDLVLQGTTSAKSIDLSNILRSHCVAS